MISATQFYEAEFNIPYIINLMEEKGWCVHQIIISEATTIVVYHRTDDA